MRREEGGGRRNLTTIAGYAIGAFILLNKEGSLSFIYIYK